MSFSFTTRATGRSGSLPTEGSGADVDTFDDEPDVVFLSTEDAPARMHSAVVLTPQQARRLGVALIEAAAAAKAAK